MPPPRLKQTKCKVRSLSVLPHPLHNSPRSSRRLALKYYNAETGNPDPVRCPRGSKVCWYIHPGDPEWDNRGKFLSSPPRGPAGRGRKKSLGSRIGRGRSRSRTRSRSRSRSRERGGGRGRSEGRSRSGGRYVSPVRRRPRASSPLPPPRRTLHERLQRSHSPPPPSPSRNRARSRSPSRREPKPRRPRTRTSTPISSSRGPSPLGEDKSGSSPQRVKPEPSTDAVPSSLSKPTDLTLGDVGMEDQTPVLPQGSVDQHPQRPSLDLSLGERPTHSTQEPSPLAVVDPFSPVFAPETPVIPGLTASVQHTQQNTAGMSSLQRSLEQVLKDQVTIGNPSTVPLGRNTSVSNPATVPAVEKTEIWTTRVKCVKFTGFVKETRSSNITVFEKTRGIGCGLTY